MISGWRPLQSAARGAADSRPRRRRVADEGPSITPREPRQGFRNQLLAFGVSRVATIVIHGRFRSQDGRAYSERSAPREAPSPWAKSIPRSVASKITLAPTGGKAAPTLIRA